MLTGMLQPTHLIILLAIALIVLGPKRLPDAGRALGPVPPARRHHRQRDTSGRLTEGIRG
jgi:Sec-independent protein translocase protein TatA